MPNNEFTVEKLKGAANYHNWSFAMENFMDSKSFGDTIRPIRPSTDDDEISVESNREKLLKAKGFLVMGIDS